MAKTRAMVFERMERWTDAVEQYQGALNLDDSVAFAKQGLQRAQARADLDAKLTALLDQPSRLFDGRVLQDANKLLADGRAVKPQGQRLSDQLIRLDKLIVRASTPVAVRLVSDGLTEVTVYRVGKLGRFANHELQLRPGNYTAVGSRDGYRDVRATFKIRPGSIPGPIEVRCSEPI